MTSKLLSTPQAASMLGLAAATLVDWRHKRQGPRYAKIGRLVRYHEQDVVAFLSSRFVEPCQHRKGGQEDAN